MTKPQNHLDPLDTHYNHGQPARKSNGRRAVTNPRTGKPMIIKSAAAIAWVEDALKQIPHHARQHLGSLEHPLYVEMVCYYKTRKPDLSGELVLDMLEEAGVIENDRYVYRWLLDKQFSKDRPGVQIYVWRL